MVIVFFWSVFLLIISLSLLYPLILSICCSKEPSSPKKTTPVNGFSIILPCYNEERYVASKLRNLLAACAHSQSFEIIVISDGSTDNTNRILKQFKDHENISLITLSKRHGKPHALNLGVSKSQFETLIFSDARQVIDLLAIEHLLKNFADNDVGAVTAKLINGRSKSPIRSAVNRLKAWESKSGSTVGVYGAFYALKKKYFKPIPEHIVLDDLYVSLVVLTQGKKVVMEQKSIVRDVNISKFYSAKRIRRIVHGLLQMLTECHGLIKKLSPQLKAYLFFQKYLKLMLPMFIAVLYALNILLLNKPSYLIIFIFWNLGIITSSLWLLIKYRKDAKLVMTIMGGYFRIVLKVFSSYSTVKWEKTIELPQSAQA